MIKLLTTDSYFNMFDLLIKSLSNEPNEIDRKNIVFCEEKVSLMIERMIASSLGGSFNTEVYSFGNFLRAKKNFDNLLTKEGSAMVVKSVLSNVKLTCFKASKQSIAPTIYDLIIQLKSAKITPDDIKGATDKTEGILKNKLLDTYTIFTEYEKFVLDNGFEDQSSVLSYLPEIILNDDELSNANVYLVGFSGFTAQIKSAINALLQKSNNITAILCEGDNLLAFVNETANYIKNLAKENGCPFIYNREQSNYNAKAKAIMENLFYPFAKKMDTNELSINANVYYSPIANKISEVERVAEIIKSLVITGDCRYKDITIAIPDQTYSGYISSVFNTLDIPFFIDERKKPLHHPLIKLITSYIDIFRKNFERKCVLAFIKNPYFCGDKKLTDRLENYILKYNLNYARLKEQFTFSESEIDHLQGDLGLKELNDIMDRFRKLTLKFDIDGMLTALCVKESCEKQTERLNDLGKIEESAINAQIYTAVESLLAQMRLLLGQVKLGFNEYRNVFLEGVSALEMSIIPQYNDAVFVGDYKQTALAKAKHLFAIGLTAGVPNVKADVSLLSDRDIDRLEQVKVLIEPKINIVNHRVRENVALALSAFNKSLYLSYPISTEDGTKNTKSEVIKTIEELFPLKEFPMANGYLTQKQGLKTFAKDCGQFAEGKTADFIFASSFYQAVRSDLAKDLVEWANKDIVIKLENSKEILVKEQISPTTVEDYYKCPYRSFLSHGLRLKEREEGSVDVLSVGNLMHEIFSIYAKEMNKVTDLESSNALFERAKDQVVQREEYKKFLLDGRNNATVNRVLDECKKYCYKTYLSFTNSNFSVKTTEASFGDGKFYPAIKLLGGKVKIKGKIDRVDESQNYFRVIDYKTGSTDATDKGLFSGTKLQLFLYAKAVAEKYKDSKNIAGLYYLPVSDKYQKDDEEFSPMADGRTLLDETAIFEQDKSFFDKGLSQFLPNKLDAKGNVKNALSKDDLGSYVDYAVQISELAVKQMQDGSIVASPYGSACEYCQFKGLCNDQDWHVREIGTVKEETITKALLDQNTDEGEISND